MTNIKLWRSVLLALKHTFGFRTRISIARKWQGAARGVVKDAGGRGAGGPRNVTIIPHKGEVR